MIGRTKGGMNTKLHAVTDANGRPLSFFIAADQVSDYIGAAALLADRGFVAVVRARGLAARGEGGGSVSFTKYFQGPRPKSRCA